MGAQVRRMRSAQEARHVAALVVPAWTIAITLSVPFVVQGATHSGKLFPAASRSQSGAPDTSRRWSSSGCFFLGMALAQAYMYSIYQHRTSCQSL